MFYVFPIILPIIKIPLETLALTRLNRIEAIKWGLRALYRSLTFFPRWPFETPKTLKTPITYSR
jgi:hypothetical protein